MSNIELTTATTEQKDGIREALVAQKSIADSTPEQKAELRALLGVTPRAVTIAYASTVTPNADTTDIANIGTLTANITVANPTGTPADGQKLLFRLTQDGTGSRTLTWGNAYSFGTDITEALIPSTAGAKWRMVFIWCAATSKWEASGIARGF